MLYIRWGKRGSARTWRRFCMSTIGHIGGFVWTCLRISIVSGNQLAIVSIPGDRLFEIGSRMVREQESGGSRKEVAANSGGTDRKR